MVENYRAILRSFIGALAIHGSGIMRFQKNLKQLAVTDNGWVVFNLAHFGVTGRAGADLFVSGILSLPAGIAGSDSFDAVEPLEDRLCAPEATAAKGR